MPKVNNKKKVNKKNTNKSKVIKKSRFNYNKADVKLALAEVIEGKKVAEVSRKYNIPESTIRAKKLNKYSDKPPGPSTVLSYEEENELVEWIFYCCKQGFPVTKNKLVESVEILCDSDNRKTPFPNNKPGRSWLEGFLKRHPNVSEKLSEYLSATRAKVTEYQIRGWFTGITNYFTEFFTDENFTKIDGTRIFNGDAIGVSMCPKPSSVLAPKGIKNVYNTVSNNEKENVTVLVMANAAGNLAPTLVLFAGQSVPKDVTKMGPSNFSFGYSDNGWMTAKNFYEYITNVFFPWVLVSNIELPIILYIDGLSSHVTLPLSKFCSENKIILVALCPNATHILQPLEVVLFRTFRAAYQRSIQALCEDSGTKSIKKSQVARALKKTFESLNLKKILENGFKTCGLHPLNVNAIDYSKVFKKLGNSSSETPSIFEDTPELPEESEALKVLESLIDKDKLISFKDHDSSVWKGRKEDESLYDIWYKLAKPTNTPNVASSNEIFLSQEQNVFNDDVSVQSLSERTLIITDDPEATSSRRKVEKRAD
ncbi:uncharacterized protein LOC130678024 [Microplitis mediator]|uniref:uncharacterized protein LOC130678024 n=1 Tax=Microplitis mediator TaxID=375433 RepID=UPI0025530223|nr:uncharacterized protein LOC130678024 [Microplitis mediator]